MSAAGGAGGGTGGGGGRAASIFDRFAALIKTLRETRLEDGTRFVVEERPASHFLKVRVVGPEPPPEPPVYGFSRGGFPPYEIPLALYKIELPSLALSKLAGYYIDTTPARLAALQDIVSAWERSERAVMLQKIYKQRPELPGAIMNHIEGYAGQANPPHFFGGSAIQPAYENPGAATGGGSSSTSMNALNRKRKTRRASRRSTKKRATRRHKY